LVFGPRITVPRTKPFDKSKLSQLLSIMATITSVWIPNDVTVYTATAGGLNLTTVGLADKTNNGMLRPSQSVLYVGFKYSTSQHDDNLNALGSLLATKLPIYKQTGISSLETWDPKGTPGVDTLVTYFVPYGTSVVTGTSAVTDASTLNLHYDSITAEMARLVGLATATTVLSQITDSSSQSLSDTLSAGSASSNASVANTSPTSTPANITSTVPELPSGASASIASAAGKAAIASVEPTTLGAAIGGSVGGLIVGIAAALIAFACLRRRGSHGKQAHRSRAGDETIDTRELSMSKEMQLLEAPAAITGWQKHLPQEKDDRTITEAVKTIFDQVRIHMEGFYSSKPGKLTSLAASALEHVSPGGLPRKLSEAPNSLPILESILIRWIVHRISLRVNAEESFLPFEYTNIPKRNEWHMENDEQGSNRVEGSRKGQRCVTRLPSIPADRFRLSPSIFEMAHAHCLPVS
jgi:hypothetical protein